MQDYMLDFAAYVRELLPEELAEPFIALARPAVRLSQAEEGETVVGRLGGLPRLPEGVPWPSPGADMQFLAELDCAALTGYESGLDLPSEGSLLFFAHWECTSAHVILLPPGVERVPDREVPVSGDAWVYPEVPLAGETVATWPTRGHDELVGLGDDFWDRIVGDGEVFATLLDDFAEADDGHAHQIGGYSDALHSPIEAEGARAAGLTWRDPGFAAEAAQWVNLLQLDEDNEMIFGDGAILTFGIRRDRLAARDFSQVLPHVQGH